MKKLLLILFLILLTGCGQSEAEKAYPALLEKDNKLQAEYLDLSGKYTSLDKKYSQLVTDKKKTDDALLAEQNKNRQINVDNQALRIHVEQLTAFNNSVEEIISQSDTEKNATIDSLNNQIANLNAILLDTRKKLAQAEQARDKKDWASLDELKKFVKDHKAEMVVKLLPGKDGIAQFDGQCVGAAMGWRDLAELYGKNLNIQIVSPAEYERAFKKKMSDYHAVVSAIIAQKDIYYFDSKDPEYIMLGAVIP